MYCSLLAACREKLLFVVSFTLMMNELIYLVPYVYRHIVQTIVAFKANDTINWVLIVDLGYV
jgi:hypothetical protein